MDIMEIIAVGLCILLAVVMIALIAACNYDSNTRSIPKPDAEDDKEDKDE